VDNAEHEPATSRTRIDEGEQRERLAGVKQRERAAEEHEHVAGEVKVPQGKLTPPPLALVGHEGHDNELRTHGIVHADASAVEPPPNNEVPGEYRPPPPPPDPPPSLCTQDMSHVEPTEAATATGAAPVQSAVEEWIDFAIIVQQMQ